MNKQLALEVVGSLSAPSKMPCHCFSLSAKECWTGGKLQKIPNSVCSECYALRGHYRYPVVIKSLARRRAGMDNPRWAEAMAWLINNVEQSGHFRWFDSGDIQSVAHLSKIVKVAMLTPKVRHWLPTREYGFIASWVRANGAFPTNLTVRLSALMFEAVPPTHLANRLKVFTSTVSKTNYTCPAYKQGGECLQCRLCWDKSVANVCYKRH